MRVNREPDARKPARPVRRGTDEKGLLRSTSSAVYPTIFFRPGHGLRPLTYINRCSVGREAPAFTPDSYPQFTNGGEEQDERLQEAFAKRASLSRWFAIQEDHHGSVPDSPPGVPLPSRRCPESCVRGDPPVRSANTTSISGSITS